MRAPRVPDDDAERVVALRSLCLLDTGPEERFDRITRTAAALLDVPIALVNLVDDRRQWAKSAVGFDQGAEVERRTSFCAHVVGDAAPLFIPETLVDERFHDNPMVIDDDPGLRAYFGVPVRGSTGKVLGSLCIADHEPRDLSEDQLAVLSDLAGWVEAEFDRSILARLTARERRARRRVEAITAALGDGIVLIGASGEILEANPAAERLVGVAPGDLVGRDARDLLASSDRAALRQLLASGPLDEVLRWTVTLVGVHGPVDVELTISSLAEDDTFVATVRDVSARRQVERLKDEFVSTVSHELRTPLTALKGTLALTLGGVTGELPAEASSLLQVAHNNTDRLIRLVNEILDIERLAAGRVELSYTTVEVGSLVRTAVDNVASIAEAAGVPVQVAVPQATCEVDEDRVVQALTNLLGNAVRFSSAGGTVEVAAQVDEDQVRLTVTDEGRGIPPTDLDRIFDRFGQVDASDSRERSGTGLGLPIARGMAEAHGGALTVRSEVGVGSTFELALPRHPAAEEPR